VAAFVVRRLLQGVFVMVMAVTVAFLVTFVLGDPVISIVGPEADAATIERMRVRWGLDRPLHIQYGTYLTRAATGDFGMSTRYRRPVGPLMLERLGNSVQLALPALAISVVLSIVLGILSASQRNRWPDYVARGLALFGQAAPVFWVAIMFIVVFSLVLGWFPASGRGDWRHMVLPVITLSLWPTAYLTRIMRSSILDVLGLDYIRTARGKGVGAVRILVRHALRNALIPFVTVGAMQLATIMSGSMIVETIFNWPGFGQLMLNAVRQLDIPLVSGTIALTAVLAVVMNLLADVTYGLIDPRVSR
jgi:peptide/nickel transport system permease protein